MSTPRHDRWVRRSASVYRELLRWYPKEFRERFADDLTDSFVDLCRQAARRRGLLGLVGAWARGVTDLLVQGIRERWRASAARTGRALGVPGTAPSRQRPLAALGQDAFYAGRSLRRQPGFSSLVVLTLAVGMGASTAMFSVFDAVLLRPLPFRDSGRLVMLWERRPEQGRERNEVSPADFIDWRRFSKTLEETAAYAYDVVDLIGLEDPLSSTAGRVHPSFFDVLGAKAAIGRTFVESDAAAAAGPVVILGQGLWQRRFGADEDIVGRTIRLDGVPHTVVGVMPEGFEFPRGVDLWVPLMFESAAPSRTFHFLHVIGRLAEDATLDRARRELRGIAARLEREYPDANAGHTVSVFRLRDELVGEMRPALYLLLGGVGILLAIACVNVAHLLLARSATRRGETAVRSALGAGRARLLTQLIIESVMLAFAGGAVGLVGALWGVPALSAVVGAGARLSAGAVLDLRVLAFGFAVSVTTGVLFGLVPGLELGSAGPPTSLRPGGTLVASPRGHRLRSVLVAGEVALALLLLIGTGLLVKSFVRLSGVDPGFDPDRLLTARVDLATARYSEPGDWNAFFGELTERVRALPGVVAVGATTMLPLSGNDASRFIEIEGLAPSFPEDARNAHLRIVTPGYFRAMGVPIKSGRDFGSGDDPESPWVVIVNERLAARYWPDRDPLRRRMRPGGVEDWFTVVGVVGDVRHRGLAGDPEPEMYYCSRQFPSNAMTLAIRTAGEPEAPAASVREQVWTIDPDQPVTEMATMRERMAASVANPRATATVLAIFAAIAATLAVVGTYGVVSYLVARRRAEIGVRMALGATNREVAGMIVRQGMVPVVAGIAAAVLLALGLTRLLRGLLYEVRPADPGVFAAVSLLIAAVAFVGTVIPARRSTRIDPARTLRSE